jgi:hypothetical protein
MAARGRWSSRTSTGRTSAWPSIWPTGSRSKWSRGDRASQATRTIASAPPTAWTAGCLPSTCAARWSRSSRPNGPRHRRHRSRTTDRSGNGPIPDSLRRWAPRQQYNGGLAPTTADGASGNTSTGKARRHPRPRRRPHPPETRVGAARSVDASKSRLNPEYSRLDVSESPLRARSSACRDGLLAQRHDECTVHVVVGARPLLDHESGGGGMASGLTDPPSRQHDDLATREPDLERSASTCPDA